MKGGANTMWALLTLKSTKQLSMTCNEEEWSEYIPVEQHQDKKHEIYPMETDHCFKLSLLP